jgi:two-component system NtrC family sensor kinase
MSLRSNRKGEVAMAEPTKAQLLAKVAALAATRERLDARVATAERTAAEALEQQTATSDILRVISSSPTDVRPVFDAIAPSAARLCEALDAAIFRRDGDRLILAAHHGPIPIGPIGEFTVPLGRGSVSGRSVLDGRTVHVADVQAEWDFPETSHLARQENWSTILSIP